MRTLSRWLRRWEMLRVTEVVLGLAWIALALAYLFGEAETGFIAQAAIAAATALVIAAAGFLYAWREPAPLDR